MRIAQAGSQTRRVIMFDFHFVQTLIYYCVHVCRKKEEQLTEVWLVGATFQLHTFRAALNQEVPHELITDVTYNKRDGGQSVTQTVNVET